MIDGTKGKGQRSSGGEGESADPDLHPPPTKHQSQSRSALGGGWWRGDGGVGRFGKMGLWGLVRTE